MNREASFNHNREPAQQVTVPPRPASKDHRLTMPDPQPGELILVERSGWYALHDGDLRLEPHCSNV
jgi:hypothetical protein